MKNKITSALFGAIVCAMVAGVGCSTMIETGSGGSGGSATTSVTSSTTTSSTSSSTSATTSVSTGVDGDVCLEMCVASNSAAFQRFKVHQLQECGCANGSPCASQCPAECTDNSTLNPTSPCGMCLSTEFGEGMASMCTNKAGLKDCIADSTCSAFMKCALACP